MKCAFIAIFVLAGCKQHVCAPPERIIKHYDTIEVQRIDTLVIIQTYDTLPEPIHDAAALMWLKSGEVEMRPSELFKDGKRSDTIWRHTPIYY